MALRLAREATRGGAVQSGFLCSPAHRCWRAPPSLLTIEGHPALVAKQETTMTKTKTTMSALALAAAAFATTTLLAGGASATPALTGATPSQHIPVTQAFPKPPGLVNHIPVNQVFPKPPHPVLGIPVLPKPPHPVLGIPVNPGMGKGG